MQKLNVVTGTGTLEGFEDLVAPNQDKELTRILYNFSNFNELIINNTYSGTIESIGRKYCCIDIDSKHLFMLILTIV
jgi:hypothetical protein